MGQGYRKFRRRMLRAALLRSILPGASLALAVFSVLLVLHKRMIISLSLLPLAALGAGIGLILTAVLLAVLFPYKKRLARKLDKELALREGVQTMLAFADRQDDMMLLQREQTEQRLQATPAKKLKIRHVWTCLVCFLLAAFMSVTAFAIPAKQPEPPTPPVEPPFSLNAWEEIALTELIEQVRTSTMTEPAKSETVAHLEMLLRELYTTETQSRMKTLVVDTVLSVRDSVDGVVTLRSFSPILSTGGSPYSRALDKALANVDQTAFKQELDGIVTSLSEIKDKDELIEAVHVFSEELKMVLRNSGAAQEDALYIELERLAGTLSDIATGIESYTLTWGRLQITDAFGVAYTQMGKALTQQRYDADMGLFVETRLLEIFGLSALDLPTEEGEDEGPQTPGDYEDDDDNQTITDGGLGSGELILGSQDIIYDPNREDYVKYSEVIDLYNAIFIEKKVDGLLPEDVAVLIEAYFAELFSPPQKD